MKSKIIVNAWERIDDTTERLRVHNGWLVHRTVELPWAWGDRGKMPGKFGDRNVSQLATSMVFVVDQLHQWALSNATEQRPEGYA